MVLVVACLVGRFALPRLLELLLSHLNVRGLAFFFLLFPTSAAIFVLGFWSFPAFFGLGLLLHGLIVVILVVFGVGPGVVETSLKYGEQHLIVNRVGMVCYRRLQIFSGLIFHGLGLGRRGFLVRVCDGRWLELVGELIFWLLCHVLL